MTDSARLTPSERLSIQRAVQRLTMRPAARGERDLSSALNPVEAEVERILNARETVK